VVLARLDSTALGKNRISIRGSPFATGVIRRRQTSIQLPAADSRRSRMGLPARLELVGPEWRGVGRASAIGAG
jgi:hypothetical protein